MEDATDRPQPDAPRPLIDAPITLAGQIGNLIAIISLAIILLLLLFGPADPLAIP